MIDLARVCAEAAGGQTRIEAIRKPATRMDTLPPAALHERSSRQWAARDSNPEPRD